MSALYLGLQYIINFVATFTYISGTKPFTETQRNNKQVWIKTDVG